VRRLDLERRVVVGEYRPDLEVAFFFVENVHGGNRRVAAVEKGKGARAAGVTAPAIIIDQVKATFFTGCLLIGMGITPAARAHAFGQRYDLPAPLGYFIAGAAVMVALTFFVAELLMRHAVNAGKAPQAHCYRTPQNASTGIR
jgi:hypothetical protein